MIQMFPQIPAMVAIYLLLLCIGKQYVKGWGVFSAAAIVGSTPILILFALLQNELVSGLTHGEVKE